MSQYDQLKMLYTQLINLTSEEDKLVDAKAFDELDSRLNYKDKLIKRIVVLKSMIDFTPNQAQEFMEMQAKYKLKEEANIEKFSKIKDDLGSKLVSTQKNIKLKTAYIKNKVENQGSLLDFSE